MSDSPTPEAFDAQVFWISFAFCALPPLAMLGSARTSTGPYDGLILFMLLSLLTCAVYVAQGLDTPLSLVGRDHARGLAAVAGMVAGAMVGFGAGPVLVP